MKKFSLILAILAGLTLVFSFAAEKVDDGTVIEEIHQHSFDVKANGTVSVDGVQFKSMTEYFTSDHFKGTSKRCKPVDPRIHGHEGHEHGDNIDRTAGSQADCSLSCTTIKSEYATGNYTIPIVFHVIYKNDGTGNIPDSRIINQVAVLNLDYQGTGISFELAGITRHRSNRYFADRNERYKQSYGWNQDEYLNVYTNSASGYLGYAYFPQDSAGEWWDGVVLLYSACGGRNEGSAPYNQGRTLVHEIGHYLGLYHTFQDGCGTGYCAGDRINDTNPEAAPYYYCGTNYSCGSPDPTTNYMDYSEDLCMYEFTDEQANRAVCSLVNYRASLWY